MREALTSTYAERIVTGMMGNELKRIRIKFGESQTAFARRLGINQSTLCRWEANGLPDRAFTKEAVRQRLGELTMQADYGELS